MSKRVAIERYRLIIHRLRKSPASFKEISTFLEIESEVQGYDFTISRRTFIRDKEEIESLFNTIITYQKNTNKYSIEEDTDHYINTRMYEAFDTYHALQITDRVKTFIHIDKRASAGTEHLYNLLLAVENHKTVEFNYSKFISHDITTRKAHPLALKEFRNRWYLIALESKDNKIKIFGLDRISNLRSNNVKFTPPSSFNVHEYFSNTYGIIVDKSIKPEEIILSFIPEQSKYIQTRPLHPTQEIIIDDQVEFRIKLYMAPTLDLKMELLSYGSKLKVLAPQSLIDSIQHEHIKAAQRYQ